MAQSRMLQNLQKFKPSDDLKLLPSLEEKKLATEATQHPVIKLMYSRLPIASNTHH